MRARTRRAFSLVELLTVIGIIALLISILMPALGRSREIARRTVCLANLRGIAQGCVTYAEASKGRFPSWGQKHPGFNAIGDYWDWDGVSPNTLSGVAVPAGTSPLSNTRNLWKLIQLQAADTKTWLCPSDGDAGEPFTPAVLDSKTTGNSSISDVQNRSQFSYAFQYQGPAWDPAVADKIRDGWNTTTKDDPKLVILADASPCFRAKNPSAMASRAAATPDDHSFEFASSTASTTFPSGNRFVAAFANIVPLSIVWDPATAQARYAFNNRKDVEDLNSLNHRNEGQNFMRLDGSGDFASDPWAGAYKDNIWTVQYAKTAAGGAVTYGQAANDIDSQDLAARMLGYYDATNQASFELDVLKIWLLDPQVSKTRFPDSFLVP